MKKKTKKQPQKKSKFLKYSMVTALLVFGSWMALTFLGFL